MIIQRYLIKHREECPAIHTGIAGNLKGRNLQNLIKVWFVVWMIVNIATLSASNEIQELQYKNNIRI